MKIKTFIDPDAEVVDKRVNEFESTNKVRATHTDMILNPYGVLIHKAVVFYLEE